MDTRYFRIFWIFPVFWRVIACRSKFHNFHTIEPNITIGPSCDILGEYNIIGCYLLDDSSADVLANSLENASNWQEISLLLAFNQLETFPPEVFENAQISTLSFSLNCTLEGIPTEILQHVTSPLQNLEFVNVLDLSQVTGTDFQNLEFSSSLESLVLQAEELLEIEDLAFQNFGNLKELTVTGTSILQIAPNLLGGLTKLEEVTLTYNPITTIPANFFLSQSQLKNVWLGQNQLQSLEEGSLDGLDSIRMLDVAGNPFYCNCSLEWFKDWLSARDLLDASGAACAYPVSDTFANVVFCA